MSNEPNLFPAGDRKVIPPRSIADFAAVNNFRTAAREAFTHLNRDLGLSLTAESFAHLQNYYQTTLRRDPTAGELRLLDALARIPAEGLVAEHHAVTEWITDSAVLAETWADMVDKHTALSLAADGQISPITWEDTLHLTERYLRRTGRYGAPGRKSEICPIHAVLTSAHQVGEALAAGYRITARACTEDGDCLTVVSRTDAPCEDTPPSVGDVILFCPAVSMANLSSLASARQCRALTGIGALRVVTRRPLLLTALELACGLELYPHRLPTAKPAHAQRLPVDTLCRMPRAQADAFDVLLRTGVQQASALMAELRGYGLTATAIGQVTAGESVILHLPANGQPHDPIAVRVPPALLQDMGTLSAQAYRPTLREDTEATVGRPALSRLPGVAYAEDGMAPAGWETVALTASSAGTLSIPELYMDIGVTTARITIDGTGYKAAMEAISAAIAAVGGREASPCLTVRLAIEGGLGDLTAEVMCGLYRAAAENGLPLLHPVLTVPDAQAPSAVALTVVAYRQDKEPEPAADALPAPRQWSNGRAAAPEGAHTFLLPALRRSMEGSLRSLARALNRRGTASCILQPMALLPTDSDGAEALDPTAVATCLGRMTPTVTPVFAMSERDAALLLREDAVRERLEHHIADGGKLAVVGPACRAFAACGYLPCALTEAAAIPAVGTAEVLYADPSVPPARRLIRGILLAAPAAHEPHLLTLTLTDGSVPVTVPDGFIGREGAVLGLLCGLDTQIEPLLHQDRFPLPAAANVADTADSFPTV